MRSLRAALAVLAASAAVAVPAVAHGPLPASVAVTDCDAPAAAAPAERTASFTGRMSAIPGTARMAMRFTVLERLGRGRYRRIDVPVLRRWHRSAPGVRGFVYTQRLRGLKGGAAYRALVRFAWYDASGGTLLRTSRISASCGGGPLPNLAVTGLTARPGPTPDTRVYEVVVANNGRAPAAHARVVLRVDGSAVDAARVQRLAPGDQRVLTFTGPVCRRWVTAIVDPGNLIGEKFEYDDVRRSAC